MANLGDYMFSATGYGDYGFGDSGKLLAQGLSILGKAAGVAGDVGGAVLFEQIDVAAPEEVKGAKLSRGFKIEKDGEKFKIVIDMDAANRLIPGGIPAPVRAVVSNFTGAEIPDIKQDFEVSLAPLGTIKYTAPPANYMMYAGIAVAVVVLAIVGSRFL